MPASDMADKILLLDPRNAPLYWLVRDFKISELKVRLGITKEHAEKIVDVVERFENAGLST